MFSGAAAKPACDVWAVQIRSVSDAVETEATMGGAGMITDGIWVQQLSTPVCPLSAWQLRVFA